MCAPPFRGCLWVRSAAKGVVRRFAQRCRRCRRVSSVSRLLALRRLVDERDDGGCRPSAEKAPPRAFCARSSIVCVERERSTRSVATRSMWPQTTAEMRVCRYYDKDYWAGVDLRTLVGFTTTSSAVRRVAGGGCYGYARAAVRTVAYVHISLLWKHVNTIRSSSKNQPQNQNKKEKKTQKKQSNQNKNERERESLKERARWKRSCGALKEERDCSNIIKKRRMPKPPPPMLTK